MLPPLSPVSMLLTPSIVRLLALWRWPFERRLLTCVGVSLSATTPGTIIARPKKLRPLTARFCIACDCMVKARSPLRSWISVVAAVTVMVSDMLPTCIVNVPRPSRSAAFTSTGDRSRVVNPSSVTFMV